MSDTQVNAVFTGKDNLTPVVQKIEKSVSHLDKTFGSFKSRVKAGFDFNVGAKAADLMFRGFHDLANVIPDLISKGERWAHTVDQIGDITGMTAQQSSELAAVAENVAVSSDSIGRAMNAMARSTQRNPDIFEKLGVSIKDANGAGLDSYTIFQKVRERLSQLGPSLRTANIAQQIFGRGSLELSDLLALTGTQYRKMADEARRSGLIMTDGMLRNAEELERVKGRLEQAFVGLGSQILGGAAPALDSLITGVTRAIQTNMSAIVNFVTGAINFVAGMVGGFLGADLSGVVTGAKTVILSEKEWLAQQPKMQTAAQKTAASTKAATSAIQQQVAAIDRQLAALDKGNQRAQARREYQQDLADIASARRDLEGIRGEVFLKSRMSEADYVLAKQDQAARASDAQKKLIDAEKKAQQARRDQAIDRQRERLTNQRDHLQAMLQQQQAATQRQAAIQASGTGNMHQQYLSYVRTMKHSSTDLADTMTKSMEKTAADAQRFGAQIADAIQDAIFGPDKTVTGPGIHGGITVRSGGLLDAMSKVGDFLGKLVGLMPGNTDALVLLAGAYGVSKVAGAAGGAAGGLGSLLGGTGVGGALSTVASAVVPALIASGAFNAIADRVLPAKNAHSESLRPNVPGLSSSGFLPGWLDPAEISSRLMAAISDSISGGGGGGNRPTGGPGGPSGGKIRAPWSTYDSPAGSPFMDPIRGTAGLPPGLKEVFDLIAHPPGFGAANTGPNAAQISLMNRYFGQSSILGTNTGDTASGTKDNTGWLANTSDNTSTIPDGISIADWLAGRMPTSVDNNVDVNNTNFGDIGSITGIRGGVKIPVKAGKGDIPTPAVHTTVKLPGKIKLDTQAIVNALARIENLLNGRNGGHGYSMPASNYYTMIAVEKLAGKTNHSAPAGSSSLKPS